MKKKIGIYVILVDGVNVIYIGSSTNIHKRWDSHKSLLRNNKHYSKLLQDIYNKYGEDAIIFEIIEECPLIELAMAEETWMSYYEEKDYYVVNKNCVYKYRRKYSDETRQKMSEAQRGSGNGNSKLSEEEVDDIRRLIKDGLKSKEIAKEYNVSFSLIEKIKYGHRWKQVV